MISSLKHYKSPGPDEIPTELIKQAGAEVWEEIYNLVWDIWVKEKMPDEWGEAIIVPIYKKKETS